MIDPIAPPSNRFLVRRQDRSWYYAFTAALLISAAVMTILFLVGWPRLKTTAIHYELTEIRESLGELEEAKTALKVRLEQHRAPHTLAQRAAELGLVPPYHPSDPSTGSDEGGP